MAQTLKPKPEATDLKKSISNNTGNNDNDRISDSDTMEHSPKWAKRDADGDEEDLAVEISTYIYVSAPAPPVA